ncbi:MAG: MerR family DNA-binding transcriptional regulator, partial [Coprobacillus sp.]
MSKLREKYFTTGEFARICKVPKHVLFHYDEIGLFKPTIVKENQYRYYS